MISQTNLSGFFRCPPPLLINLPGLKWTPWPRPSSLLVCERVCLNAAWFALDFGRPTLRPPLLLIDGLFFTLAAYPPPPREEVMSLDRGCQAGCSRQRARVNPVIKALCPSSSPTAATFSLRLNAEPYNNSRDGSICN